MSMLKEMLNKEFERLNKLSKLYTGKISDLPKGSISIKKQGNNSYAYLVYREKGKICFDYVGKEKSEKVKELKEKLKERKKYERLLKEVKVGLDEVKWVLKGICRKKRKRDNKKKVL